MRKWMILVAALMLWAQVSFSQTIYGGGTSYYVPLLVDGVSAGNGADLTEDVIKTYTVPANTMVNIGDVLEITAAGTFGATTDSKQAFIRINGAAGLLLSNPLGNAASQIRWSAVTRVVKTGTTSVSVEAVGSVLNGNVNGANAGAGNVTTTATTDVVVAGKNATNSVAGSITVQYFSVTLIRAPSS